MMHDNRLFETSSPIHRLRFWLIRLLAGRSVVVLNARFNIVKGDGVVEVDDEVDGCLIADSLFPCGELFGESRCLSVGQVVKTPRFSWVF